MLARLVFDRLILGLGLDELLLGRTEVPFQLDLCLLRLIDGIVLLSLHLLTIFERLLPLEFIQQLIDFLDVVEVDLVAV